MIKKILEKMKLTEQTLRKIIRNVLKESFEIDDYPYDELEYYGNEDWSSMDDEDWEPTD